MEAKETNQTANRYSMSTKLLILFYLQGVNKGNILLAHMKISFG